MEEFDFDEAWKPLNLENFDEDKIPTISNANVWHEIGHALMHCINSELEYDFGRPQMIKLNKIKSFFRTDLDVYFYNQENSTFESVDCYGETNNDFFADDYFGLKSKMEETINSDEKRAIAFMIYLISGGLFNIYAIEKNFSEIILENCFKHCKGDIDLEQEYIACGGGDWDKTKRIACVLNWSYEKLIRFRNSICEIFSQSPIYEEIELLINRNTEVLSKETIEGEHLDNLMLQLKKIVTNNETIIPKLKELIIEYNQ